MNEQINKNNPVYYLTNAKQFNDKGVNVNRIDNINTTQQSDDTQFDIITQNTLNMPDITQQNISAFNNNKVFKASEIFKEIEGTGMSYFEAEEKLKKAGYEIINDLPNRKEKIKEELLQSIGAKSEVQLPEKDFISQVIENTEKYKQKKSDGSQSLKDAEEYIRFMTGDKIITYIENGIRGWLGFDQVKDPITYATFKTFAGGLMQAGITLVDYITPDSLVSAGFTKSLDEAYNYIEEWKETDNFLGKLGGEVLGFFVGGGAVKSALKYFSQGPKLISEINNGKYIKLLLESIAGTTATGTRPDKQPLSFTVSVAAPSVFSFVGKLISKGAEYYKLGYTTHEIAKKLNEKIATTSDNVLKIIKKYNLHNTNIEDAYKIVNKAYKTIETQLKTLSKGKTVDIKHSIDAKKVETGKEVIETGTLNKINNEVGTALNTVLDEAYNIFSKNSNLYLDKGKIFFFDKIKNRYTEVNETTFNSLKNKFNDTDFKLLEVIRVQNKLLNTDKLPMEELIDIYENILKANNLPELLQNNPVAFTALGKLRDIIKDNLGKDFDDLMREKQIISLFIQQFQKFGYSLPYQDLSGSITLATGYTTGNPLLMAAGAIILGLKNKSFVEFLINSDKKFDILGKFLAPTTSSFIKQEENKKYKRIDLYNK